MKKLCLFICFILLLATTALGATEWVRQAGSTSTDYSFSIATDSAGNSYITGFFYGTAIFGTTALVSQGNSDIFVAKLDPNGNWLWARRAGGLEDDSSFDIAIDNIGNSYITGSFQSVAAFGLNALISSGSRDIFVAKLDPEGNWLMSNRAGGTDYDEGIGITTDNNGNCYITGKFAGLAYFGDYGLASAGNFDYCIAKLDNYGAWSWAVRGGGTGEDQGKAIAWDGASDLFVIGMFNDSATFFTSTLTSAGEADIFIAKLSTSGSGGYSIGAGGSYYDYGEDIKSDGNGNLYITGGFKGVVQFGSSTLNSVQSSYSDIYAAKLDTDLYWIWAVQAGGIFYDFGFGMGIDAEGDVHLAGNFWNSAYFGGTRLIATGMDDSFIAKLDPEGHWLWARKGGGTNNDRACGISTDINGNSYVTGFFYSNNAYFGDMMISLSGANDVFVARIEDPVPQEPQNITISNFGNDVIVEWDAVTLDTWDVPIEPDYYMIYYNTDSAVGPFQYLTYIPAAFTEYVHQNAGFFSSNHFYQITALKFFTNDRTGLEPYLNASLRQGMSKAEVESVLRNANKPR